MLLPEHERPRHHGYLQHTSLEEPKILGTQQMLRAHRKDGTSVPIEISVSRMDGSEGPLFLGVCHDISSRLQAEETARESAERLHDVIEALPEGFAMFDPDDRLLLCNTRFREMYRPIADMWVPGARFVDLLRAGVDHGLFPEAQGDIEGWIADRMRRHEGPGYRVERKLEPMPVLRPCSAKALVSRTYRLAGRSPPSRVSRT